MKVRSVVCLCVAFIRCSFVLLSVSCLAFANWVSAQEVLPAVETKPKLGVSLEQPAEGPFVKIDGGFMVPYKATIPETSTTFEMVPVPGGTFTMGSPEDEEGRLEDEGPQFEVVVKPFWMGKHEVTWDEYQCFMDLELVFRKLKQRGIRKKLEEFAVDTISAPTPLYRPSYTYDAGKEYNQPAATMCQFGAKQYTKWLSLTSNQFYRLPYEAEWEYACRAGSKTAYSFGDDVDDLKKHAWFVENSDDERQVVGQKQPNAFGLFDMHGNVAEWVLDGYNEQGYTHLEAGKSYTVEQTFYKPKTIYQRVVRGGSWELDDVQCRSAARLASQEEWKGEDPQSPLSPWWLTDTPGLGVGFRLIRPLDAPKTVEAKDKFWKPDHQDIASEVIRRKTLGTADEKLPEEMRKVLDE